MPDPSWREIEADFRLWSFHVFYRKTYAGEPDSEMRFAKALVASCQPIRDRQRVYDWYERCTRRRRTHADAEALST